MAVAGAARRYAQAAFDIAKEQGTIDQWERDLGQLLEVFQDSRVGPYFQNPAVPEESKRQSLASILAGDQHKLVRNFALLLLERGRLEQLPQIVESFHGLVLEERGIAIADVTTAVELQPAEFQRVQDQLTRLLGKEVHVRTQVDSDIIGGIVVRVGDTLIDGSVQTQLRTLRQRLAS